MMREIIKIYNIDQKSLKIAQNTAKIAWNVVKIY